MRDQNLTGSDKKVSPYIFIDPFCLRIRICELYFHDIICIDVEPETVMHKRVSFNNNYQN